MSNKITLPAILDSYRPRKDGSFSITLGTNILTEEQILPIHRMHSQLVVVMLKDGESVTNEEIEIFDTIDMEMIDTRLTPSKRLYNVFYRLWEQKDKPGEFKDYYKVQMETLIEHFKQKLN